jgi:hypothetical protein
MGAGVAAAVFALAACSSGHSAITTTTTPGPVAKTAPFLRVVTAQSRTPCRAGQAPGFGSELDGKCFTLGATLARANDLSSYGISCTDPSVGWNLLLSFTPAEGAQLAASTRVRTGVKIGIVEDGVVVFSGPLNGPIGRDVEITGQQFHASELRRIGVRSGARQQHPSPNAWSRLGRCKTNDD